MNCVYCGSARTYDRGDGSVYCPHCEFISVVGSSLTPRLLWRSGHRRYALFLFVAIGLDRLVAKPVRWVARQWS